MNNRIKRILTVAIVLAMCISVLAIQAFAEEVQVAEIQSRIDAVLTQYGVTADMTDEEIAAAISAKDGNTIKATMEEITAIEEAAQSLSEEELSAVDGDLYGRFCDVMERLYNPAQIATVNVLDGQVSITDTANKNNVSNGKVTIQATGSLFSTGSNTITITNETEETVQLSFSYSVEKSSAFTIDGVSKETNGTYSTILNAGASVKVVLTSQSGGSSKRTATLTLSGFSLTVAAASSNVTFEYSGGSITVDGAAPTAATMSIPVAGAALVATPSSGHRFLGWIDGNNAILSTSASFTLKPAGDMTARAVFVSTAATATAWFLAGGDHLFNNLNEAAAYASGVGTKTVILMNNGTLPSSANETNGVYTIPSGVTLLIPYDDANTVVTTEPPVSSTGSYTKPTAYRTLTMASGAKITLNGKMSVAASLIASQTNGYNGLPNGATGQVKMNEGSSISVESGGVLYAIGFIYGSGSVEVKSNGTVYECFQLRDFRGGDATSTINNDRSSKRLFPMMQYYVQNVQVPMKLHAGAIEKGISSFNISVVGITYSEIPFVGSGSMFNITSGYIVKDYDEETDRLIISSNGYLQVNNYEFTITLSMFGSVTLRSKDYFLPINHNISIDIQTGSIEINQDIALLPGAEIKVQTGATCTLGSGTEIVLYDAAEWGNYIGQKYGTNESGVAETNTWLKPLFYIAGGTIVNRRSVGLAGLADASIMINGSVDASAGQVYATSSGANIYSTANGELKLGAPGTLATVYQATQDEKKISYIEISVVPAILQDANDTNVATSEAGTYTYYASIGRWDKPSHFFEGGLCTVCGIHLFTIEASQIYLGNNLNMGFRFVYNGAETDNLSGYTVKLSHADADAEVIYSFDDWNTGSDDNGTSYYFVVYEGLAARRMCDTISLTVYSGDTQVSNTWTDSMQDYAMRMLEDTTDADAKKRTVLVDMLNYGAEAQIHFKYNTGSLANAELTDVQKGYATNKVEKSLAPEDASELPPPWKASNLVTTSNIQFLLAFDGLDDSMTATVTFKKYDAKEAETQKVSIESVTDDETGDTFYYVALECLVVADAWQPVSVTVNDSNGEVFATCKDSIADYLARSGGTAVYAAYLKFAESAYIYFTSQS